MRATAAQEVAYALGRALQLTNILRDVGEDAERGRVYLPREYLDEAGILAEPGAVLASRRRCPAFARAWRNGGAELSRRPRRRWRCCIPRAMRPAKLMAASYKPLLKMLRDQQFQLCARPRLAAEMAQARIGGAAAGFMSVQVIGAGLAGLAAACRLAEAGRACGAARGGEIRRRAGALL